MAQDSIIPVEVVTSFCDLVADLQSTKTSSPAFSKKWAAIITTRYTEPQRHYHTLAHIHSMLLLANEHVSQIKNFPVLKLAIFFHDIIYDPVAKDNELQSIVVFRTFAEEVEMSKESVAVVQMFIERTITHTLCECGSEEVEGDLRLFLDFDLDVLGRSEWEYRLYREGIRREYGCYGEEEYCEGRIGVLERFLKRERLYFSEAFFARCELQARKNVGGEIVELRGRLLR